MTYSEKKNFIKSKLNLLSIFPFLLYFINRITQLFIIKYFPNIFLISMPHEINYLRNKIIKSRNKNISKKYFGSEITPVSLKISAEKILVVKTSSDFKINYTDIEINYSINRWSWLLRGLTDGSIDRNTGLTLIFSWLEVNDIENEVDAYSSAERIANSALFFLKSTENDFPSELKMVHKNMCINICSKLEYYGKFYTGNHIINNARGLLYGGVLTNSKDEIDLAFLLLKKYLPDRINKDGFLNERSSHYHFLFTTWIIEMYWLCQKFNYQDISFFLKPFAERLLKCCWFFLVKNKDNNWCIPLIGDISPDCTPDWLISMPWSQIALDIYQPESIETISNKKGWASLFGGSFTSNISNNIVNNVKLNYESGFHRIDYNQFTLFFIAYSDNGNLVSKHGHCDNGSFILFIDGMQFLIDSGRFDYSNSSISNYGKSDIAHNNVNIDGLPPSSDTPSWVDKKYKSIDVCFNITENGNELILSFSHSGFKRIYKKNVTHKRVITFNTNYINVNDIVTSDKPIQFMIRFHLFNFKENNKNEILPIFDQQLICNVSPNFSNYSMGDIACYKYGIVDSCKTIELIGNFSGNSIINIENRFLLCAE
jgi:hypothetical protein